MSGRNAIVSYGFERRFGVPDRTRNFPLFATETLEMDRPEEKNPNIDRSGAETKGDKLRALGGGSITGAGDSESWLAMRAHHHGYYEKDTVASGVYLYTMRTFDRLVDTMPDHYIDSLWFSVFRDQLYNPSEYVGMGAKASDAEWTIDAHKHVMIKHDLIYLRDRYMSRPEEVVVNAAYTGDWVSRGHVRAGYEYGPDIEMRVPTGGGGAIGTAKIVFGSSVMVTLTSVTTTATARTVPLDDGTPVPHDLTSGDKVTIAGVTPAGYNVTNATVTVVDAYTFTYVIVSVSGVAGDAATRAVSMDDTEVTITDDWMNALRANGSIKGTRREPMQVRPTAIAGDIFTAADGWRITPRSPESVAVYTDRPRLTAADLELSFMLGGRSLDQEINPKAISIKAGNPIEAKEGVGSKYLNRIGQPNDARRWWEITIQRTYLDTRVEQAIVSDQTASGYLKLWGAEIGSTGYEDFIDFTWDNLSLTGGGATVANAGDNDETVTLRAYVPPEGGQICVERAQTSVASIEPT